MASLNDNYLKLKAGYLFPEIGRRVKAFNDANPAAAARLIRSEWVDVGEVIATAVPPRLEIGKASVALPPGGFLPVFLVGKPDGELRELMEKAGAPAGVKPFLDGPIFTAGSRGPRR